MLSNLVSLISKTFTNTNINAITKTAPKAYNPFSDDKGNNPFLNTTFGSSSSYGKNRPVAGGYFAGYYNGRPNIVGRKLFVEV